MDFKSLFDSLADYLDFLIRLFQFRGMEEFARLGHISSKLVTFTVVGLFTAYVLSAVKKVPGYDEEPDSSGELSKPANTQSEDKVNLQDMTQVLMLSILGAFAYHGFLRIYAKVVGHPAIFSLQDTLNGIFAYNATYHPVNAITHLVRRIAKAIAINKPFMYVGLFLTFSTMVLNVWNIVVCVYTVAGAHGASIRSFVLPTISFMVLILGPLLLLGGVNVLRDKSGVRNTGS